MYVYESERKREIMGRNRGRERERGGDVKSVSTVIMRIGFRCKL